jgi:catechol 2,3-dioxygenase-like lactoylglutathione lyase family enzyme
MTDVRFGHVNVTATDWRRLAAFYSDVFGCVFVPPERDISGPVLEAATGVPGAHLRGAHLRLPGLGDDGPTLEIFQYDDALPHPGPAIKRPGWGHLAFQVPDVGAALDAVVAAGGARIGDVVTTTTATGRQVT